MNTARASTDLELGAPRVDRGFRRRASSIGGALILCFLALLLWAMWAPSRATGAGSGEGELGGSGGGSGGGAGIASGTGASSDSGAADASGAGLDDSGARAAQDPDDGAAARTDAESPRASRPPLKVGFSAAPNAPVPPAPTAPDATSASRRGGNAGGAAGGGGGKGDHSFMGVEGRGRKVVYVIDRSGSMQGDRIAHTRYELKRSIRALPADSEFFVIFFDQRALPMPAPGLVSATASNKERYSKWIDQQEAIGGTDPSEAAVQALALGADTIYLMSDGVFHSTAASSIRSANRGNCVIHTIAFHDRSGEELLQRIARENEGVYRFVAPP
ncbi:MAG: hypothetical protein FJ253_00485 [Phycisphaerae bacterium]|nr:hypothetical protein [Phycisphaerae bacterium]